MFIEYETKNGHEYARLATSKRNGGRVTKSYTQLGRVIDKERGIFKSRARGVFTYDAATDTYGTVPAEYAMPVIGRKKKHRNRPTLIVSFGDLYLFNRFVEQVHLWEIIDAIDFPNRDTLHALISYYCISPHSNRHAEAWWELTYAKLLFPNAQLASQRISDALSDIGSEEAKRLFFKAYYKMLSASPHAPSKDDYGFANGVEGEGILIDSTGLPNAAHLSATAVSNHNGRISEEVRLIYAVQQSTGLPLFFRYVPGNVIDASTIKRTIAELKANGIGTKFAILDAGYYNGKNADALMDAGVSFMSRMHSNHTAYKKVVAEHRGTLEREENLVIYNGRFVYLECVGCKIGSKADRDAYAYLGLDLTMKREMENKLSAKASDQKMGTKEAYASLQENGLFVLVATRRIARENVLPLYYTREQVEDIFAVCKGSSKILPVSVATENTFRGHLLVTFIATVIMKLIGDTLRHTAITAEMAFMYLHEHKALIYEDRILIDETTKRMNDVYKAFKITPPTEIVYDSTQ